MWALFNSKILCAQEPLPVAREGKAALIRNLLYVDLYTVCILKSTFYVNKGNKGVKYASVLSTVASGREN